MNIGEIGNFISYAWAPASVVAPLGTVSYLIRNSSCVFWITTAVCTNGQLFICTPHAWWKFSQGKLPVDITHAIFSPPYIQISQHDLLASNASDTRLNPDGLLGAISKPPFIAYLCVYVVGAVVLALLLKGSIGRQWVFVDVGLCALFGEVLKFLKDVLWYWRWVQMDI